MYFKNIFLCTFIVFISLVESAREDRPKNLEQKVQQLNDLYQNKFVVRFNGPKFKEFVKSPPRNYSVIIMFTAMASHRQCSICGHASDEFIIVANSYRYSHRLMESPLYFGIVDFDEGSDIFQMLRINTAPVFMHFPAKGKPKPLDTMDIQRVGFASEQISKWIQERTDVQIRIFRPPNYSSTLALSILFAICSSFLYVRRNNMEMIFNKNLWGIGAVLFCLTMISGQMWNHIRGPPLMHRNQQGVITYIHNSSQGQFIFETYIIIVLTIDLILVFGVVIMTDSYTKKTDSKTRKIMTVGGLALIVFLFSVILSIFKSKAHGYPYSFLIK
ncbi:Thioredoxin-like fold,Oligosaccharyl transferase complex, subunit OST3/OST6 [Cinara cedri]|uniref:Thioredoxin-like fold,Oligosaccharyl transferase complex, subunit OST3/OST6 n=1 Tax=Cinara cedri TaxID=506608 RepID=A0A5E4N3L4_9HEMI|nr:Thioredoxin-like fold,Oligosaccharyl transferase complex, subunit OST3/OST6 [Cinara cedri]